MGGVLEDSGRSIGGLCEDCGWIEGRLLEDWKDCVSIVGGL